MTTLELERQLKAAEKDRRRGRMERRQSPVSFTERSTDKGRAGKRPGKRERGNLKASLRKQVW